MKRLLVLILCCLVLTACGSNEDVPVEFTDIEPQGNSANIEEESEEAEATDIYSVPDPSDYEIKYYENGQPKEDYDMAEEDSSEDDYTPEDVTPDLITSEATPSPTSEVSNGEYLDPVASFDNLKKILSETLMGSNKYSESFTTNGLISTESLVDANKKISDIIQSGERYILIYEDSSTVMITCVTTEKDGKNLIANVEVAMVEDDDET